MSEENFGMGAFTITEIDAINLPQEYREAIKQAYLVNLPN